MTPTGGFGANTGIGDAVDLGWKLDAVLSGWGGARMLDSYVIERRPAAARSMDTALANYKGWTPNSDLSRLYDESEAGATARARIGRELLEATAKEWDSSGISLGYAYGGSPLVVDDGSPAPPDEPGFYIPTARPGHRAPHVWLDKGLSTIDLFGRGFVLLRFEGDDAEEPQALLEAAKARGVPMTLTDVRDDAARRAYERRLCLVRPDGHVAWRGEALPSPAPLLNTVTGV